MVPYLPLPDLERRARKPRAASAFPDRQRAGSRAMNPRIGVAAVGGVVVALFLLLNALFTVHQTQQALVLQFGNPVRIVQEPGLHMKVPFVQQVDYFEKRVLDFDAPSVELVLGDQKRLVVDAFARYRITDRAALPSVGRHRGGIPRPAGADRVLEPAQRARRGAAVHDPVAGPHPAHEPDQGRGQQVRWPGSASSWSTCASSAPTCRPRTARPCSVGCRPSASARPRSCAPRVPRSGSASAPVPTASAAC